METSLGGIVLDGLGGLFAVLVAVAALRLVSVAFTMAAPRDAEAVPLLHVLALFCGLALGVALVLGGPEARAFLPSRIFAQDGPWAIGLGGFFSRYALPRRAALVGLPLWLVLPVLLAGALVAWRLWRGRARLRAFAAFLLLSATTALLLHYGAHLLAWLAAQLSFWLFALGLLGFQRWRYGVPRGH